MRIAHRLFTVLAITALAAACAPRAAAAAPPPVEFVVNYDVVEEVTASLAANFDADMAALTTAKGETALAAITVHTRLPAVIFAGNDGAVPGIGVYAPSARTHAKSQGKRDSRVTVVMELFIRGSDAATVRAQSELGLEAMLATVDRLADRGAGLYGAGEEEFSVLASIDGSADADGGQHQYEETARVTFVVNDQDTIT